MMKKALGILFIFLTASVISQQKISFERDGSIYTANIDGSNQKKILEGEQHSISPDGQYISFTYNVNSKRYPAIYEISSGKTTKFETPSNGNGYFPLFSPDGSYLTFSDFISSNWTASMIEISSGKVTKLSSGSKSIGVHSPRWSPDSKSIICHDLDIIYEFDISGNPVKQFNISSDLLKQGIYLSSTSSFAYSKDKTALIFDNDWSWEDAAPDKACLFGYNISSNTITMITDKAMMCMSPFVDYSTGRIYFSGCYKKDVKINKNGEPEMKWSVYAINEDGTGLEKIIDNAYSPTVSSNK